MSAVSPLTVLMSVRNGEPFIEEAVRSILDQTYGDFEFLVLDNASTDRSREIINSLDDSRIRLIALENDVGQTAALNLGLEQISSRYVARMDADDVSHPTRFEKQMGYLAKNETVALLGSWTRIIGSVGEHIVDRCPPTDSAEFQTEILFRNVFAHSSVIFSRETVESRGGYPLHARYAQDYALWLEIALSEHTAVIPEFLVSIRKHEGQVGRSGLSSERVRDPILLLEDILARPDLPRHIRDLKRKVLARANLRYAAGLREEGRLSRALVELGRGLLLDAPGSVENDSATYIAQTVLGPRGFDWLCRTRRKLLAAG